MHTVAVLGASPRPERVSNEAVRLLTHYGHKVYPVNPNYPEVGGILTVPTLEDLPGPAHTVTLYLRPELLVPHTQALIEAAPKRVIFNPGTENREVMDLLRAAGIECVQRCTLVMLRTDLF